MTTSVAMCTYNGEKFLQPQLDSILNQSVQVDEIVVCDDGSTDSTMKILEDYATKYPKIFRIYQNAENLRSVKNFEKAISLCSNDIIFLSDQDDIWLPEKVKKMVQYFMHHTGISVLCTNGFGIDEANNILDVITIWDAPELVRQSGGRFDYFEILSRIENFATGATMAIRKKYLKEIIPFPLLEGFHHDEWIALISASQRKIEILDEKLFKYRVHNQQLVGGVFYKNSKKQKKRMTNCFSIYNEKKDFTTYKKLLKRLSTSHKKYKNLEQKSVIQQEFIKNEKQNIENLFNEMKKTMRKKYPISSVLLQISDTFTNKRRIVNE